MAELEAIQHADPATAVSAALERHDERFLGIVGFSLDVPGIDLEGDPDRAMFDQYGTRVIAGTTDTPYDERHAQLINDARLYAAAYNRLLLWKLSRRGQTRPATQAATAR
jgi:hypothetical protein